MNIFLLVVKDSTVKQTQKQMKGSQVVNNMGSHRVQLILYLVYVLHWPDDGCFTAETCSPDVIDISSIR